MWEQGRWTHEPAHVEVSGSDILVTAVEGSDAWRITSYGFIHDSEHALLAAFPDDSAVEVEFTAAFSEQFDQAGVFVRFDDEHWVKAGVEYADGACQVGAVVTNGTSDWSLAPVPQWRDRRVLVRVSRSGNAMTVRAGLAGPDANAEPRLVRVLPVPPGAAAEAGPFVCSPTRAGLIVPVRAWRLTDPDASLH